MFVVIVSMMVVGEVLSDEDMVVAMYFLFEFFFLGLEIVYDTI